MNQNPLASRRAASRPSDDPMLQHAQVWRHMHAQPDDALQQHIATLDYGLPIIGALASNPKVTTKDVIKAASGAVADQKIAPSVAVQMISEMPADPDKLQGWLRERYAMNLSAAVHAKAALLSRAQGAQAGPATPVATAPAAGPGPAAAPVPAPGGTPNG